MFARNILCHFSYKRNKVLILVSLEAITLSLLFSRLDSPSCLNLSYRRDAPVLKSLLLSFAGVSPVCPCLPCAEKDLGNSRATALSERQEPQHLLQHLAGTGCLTAILEEILDLVPH